MVWLVNLMVWLVNVLGDLIFAKRRWGVPHGLDYISSGVGIDFLRQTSICRSQCVACSRMVCYYYDFVEMFITWYLVPPYSSASHSSVVHFPTSISLINSSIQTF